MKSEPMDPKDFAARMRALITGDEEVQHSDADRLMCEVLEHWGYGEGVKVFREMNKWYA